MVPAVVLLLALNLGACKGGGGGGGGSDSGTNTNTNSPTPTPTPTPSPPPVPSSGWGSATQLGTLRDIFYTDIYDASVAVNDSNHAFVAWTESGDCGGSVWINGFDGAQWGTALNLGVTGAAAQSVAMNASGDAVVVWQKNYYFNPPTCGGITGSEIWVRRLKAGTWQAAERVSDASGEDSSFYAIDPVVTIDDNGGITVAWSQERVAPAPGVIQGTYVRRFAGTSWSTATRISSPDRYSWEVQAGVAGNGDVTVVWRQDTNPYDPGQTAGGPILPTIWAARYVVASPGWTAAQHIGTTDLVGYDYEERPRLSVGRNGHVGVLWERQKTGGTPERSIYAARFEPASVSWLAPVALEQLTAPAYWPTVAVDPAGNMQAAWIQTESNIDNLYTARLDASAGTWSLPQSLEALDTDASPPVAGIDANGRALVVWSQTVATSQKLLARHITAGGPEATVEIGFGNDPSLAVNASGFAVVAQPKTIYTPTAFMTSVYATLYVPN